MGAAAAGPGDPVPAVLEAEAYGPDDHILIRNGRTAVIADATKGIVGDRVREVADYEAFLRQTARLVRRRAVVATFGDSTTHTCANWPFLLAETARSRAAEILVVNLGDPWRRTWGEHLSVAEHFLDWCRDSDAAAVTAIFFGGLIDIHTRLAQMIEFLHGKLAMPYAACDPELRTHCHRGELARLDEDLPADKDAADRWVSRAFLATARLLERVCADRQCRFAGVFQPLCYEDCAPAYQRALRRAHAAEGGAADFEQWCRERNRWPDPSTRFGQDLRPALRRAIAAMRRQQPRPAACYVDLSALFRDCDLDCFAPDFDAIHFNRTGSGLIAEALWPALFPS